MKRHAERKPRATAREKWGVVKGRILNGSNVAATVAMAVVIAVLFLAAYNAISATVEKRALRRMEEGVKTVTQEVSAKFARDSSILNATAEIISSADDFDVDVTLGIMETVGPLLDTMRIRILLPNNQILLPDNQILTPDGSPEDVSDEGLSFQKEAALGEHVSDRGTSVKSKTPVLRHFVPIRQAGKTVAMLYGITRLDELPQAINIDNIYNASASVYIIDTKTGDFIMDTWSGHDGLGNIADYNTGRETKKDQNWSEYTEDMMNLNSGYVVFRSEQTDGWQYLYYGPAGVNQWAIAVQVPEKEAFASVYAVRNIFIVIGIVMTVAIAFYYAIIYMQAKRSMAQVVERAVLEEKLKKAEAAERAKSTFLSNMSHDIRTPMNAIIGFTTLAESNIDNKPRVQEYLAKILSSSNHLLSLINDILDMSRIESGKLNIEERPCSISDVLRDMRNIIQTQMQNKQINFFMDTMDVVDEDIYCDKLHLNQVLLNLLSNAIKFTPAGGSVSLMIQQKQGGAPKGYGAYEIRVKDTGIGMSPEFAVHIFEPFERERTSTVSGIQGTGLGMAITKSIVDTMGGKITLHTEQGRGTEFVLNFVFRLQSETHRVVPIQELRGMRGLVVDDSFSTCDSVTKMLTQIGMRAEWSMRGKEAVLRAKQAVEMGDEFYAYVIDWALPDLSGLEVVRQIRSLVGEHVPIIILTAYDWTAFEEEAKQAGVTAFCNKPIFMSELRDTLISALGLEDSRHKKEEVTNPVEHLKGKRLLLVEDNELNREIAQELLMESGFEVETACNGSVAVEMVSQSKPGYYAVVLMDVQMPVMDGYQASKAIRNLKDPALSSIPIIAMTANAFNEDRKKALESGMNDHIAKPVDGAKLLKVLAMHLNETGEKSEEGQLQI